MCSRPELEDLLLTTDQAVGILKENGYHEMAEALYSRNMKIADAVGFSGRLNVINNLLRK
jgi:hypothetical protein